MKWVTREYPHFDRLATPWLIKRFIDPDAELLFVPWGKENEAPADAIPYAMPNIELSDPHDGSESTFIKAYRKYGLDDPALLAMARMIEIGVAYNLYGDPLPMDEFAGRIAEGVLVMTLGLTLAARSDHEQVERGLILFDGLYEVFRMQILMDKRGIAEPDAAISPDLWRTLVGNSLARQYRPLGEAFADHGVDQIGPEFYTIFGQMRASAAAIPPRN